MILGVIFTLAGIAAAYESFKYSPNQGGAKILAMVAAGLVVGGVFFMEGA